MPTNATSEFRVAAVQFRSTVDIEDNLSRIREVLRAAADTGVQIAAFPECAVTSYNAHVVTKFSTNQLRDAEERLGSMCREVGIAAIVGSPYYEDGVLYNGALAWNRDGELIARYAKIQLAESWPQPGTRLVTFRVDGVVCSVIVCHDSRYPELVRLPVLAGAQVVFYLSCESDVTHETKIDPYRSQIVARAEENCVYIVHANTPQTYDRRDDGTIVLQPGCSHGQSRIIAPDGNIIAEASIFSEEMLTETLEVSRATRAFAERSRQSSLLQAWWNAGAALVDGE